MLRDSLRQVLIDLAQTERVATYRDLADSLGLVPPQIVHRVTEALEILMVEDSQAGRPLLAALCVSRLGHCLPARGFFEIAQALGVFAGEPEGPQARDSMRANFAAPSSSIAGYDAVSPAEIPRGTWYHVAH